jgi:hypothetical protein
MKRALWITLMSISLGLITQSAPAADFTFNVPVELHKIPSDIKTFGVAVWVYSQPPDADGYFRQDSTIGTGDTFVSIVNGEFVGTVTVAFNADPRKDPRAALYYGVYLLLYGSAGAGGCLNAMGKDTPYPYDPQQPLVCYLTGSIYSPGPSPVPSKPIPYNQKQKGQVPPKKK